MNALNREMYAELEQAFRDAHRDPEVRCVVLTANGRAFCSGDDVKQIMLGEQRDSTVTRLRDAKPKPTSAAAAVLECDKPVIAAVNGPAVGWGMDLTLFADIRIASQNAKFGELFIKRGLVADIGGLWRLPRVVGPSKAAELLFTGDVITADQALAIGLVSKVVPPEELLIAANEIARKIAANPPIAMRYMKKACASRSTALWPRWANTSATRSPTCSPPKTTARARWPSSSAASPCSRGGRWNRSGPRDRSGCPGSGRRRLRLGGAARRRAR